jgi:hypothetical protein
MTPVTVSPPFIFRVVTLEGLAGPAVAVLAGWLVGRLTLAAKCYELLVTPTVAQPRRLRVFCGFSVRLVGCSA